jgi:preprotein translocase subunit SecE
MNKIIQFFRDVVSEMKKVTWPSKNDVIKYTFSIILFSVVVAAILGAADFGLLRLVDLLFK